MNKICTSIKQSKKLIELGIDVKTADMYYMYRHWEIDEDTIGAQSDASIGFDSDFYCGADNGKTYHYIPAWSLSALLELMPELDGRNPSLNRIINTDKWWIMYHCTATLPLIRIKACDNPLDTAFEMVCWLLENKKI